MAVNAVPAERRRRPVLQASEPDRQPVAVPERPHLAPNLELCGRMADSAFQEAQWLASCDGRFIQLSELLYRIAEQVDGTRNLEEIADAVSDAVDRNVSAANVRQLLERRLIPLGIVANGDGTVLGSKAGAMRSPLSVNMRMAVLTPRAIDPATRVLQWLYWPPVLLAVLAAGAVAQGWLLFVHGIGSSVREALYSPALLVGALSIVIIAAALHEFGHAAALRYAGGKPGKMGVGLYIIYPAFYTNVSDNYRFGRWARVRTDLGGFYFNLVFGLLMMALYAVTGWEILLIVVLMVDLDIVRQLMPFVRLDGYWALVDLTGMPDFFSNIPAFLRTVLPLPFWRGRKLPDVRPWVKLVFALYIVVTVPLLAFLLLMMVKSVPRILATAWDSAGELFRDFSTARAQGDLAGMAAAVVQVGILAVPVAGMFFVLYMLGKRAARAAWRWSRPTWPRRVAGATSSLAIVGLVAFLWAPQLPAFLPAEDARGSILATSWQPIREGERGTIGEALGATSRRAAGADSDSGRTANAGTGETTPEAGGPAESPTPVTTATSTPDETTGTATASPTATATATPTATVTAPTPTATTTAVEPTPSPTPTPGSNSSGAAPTAPPAE